MVHALTDVVVQRPDRNAPERLAARAQLVRQYSWTAVTARLQALIAEQTVAA